MNKAGIFLVLPVFPLAQQAIIKTTILAFVLIANILVQLAAILPSIAQAVGLDFSVSVLEAVSSTALQEHILTLQQLYAIPVLILALLVNSEEITVQVVPRLCFSTPTAPAYPLVTLLMQKILPLMLVKNVNILAGHATHHQLIA